jgi:3,4-dihydroxy 2-butanone 4-phosphate synthase/GTP cyclohydrolase II
LKQLGAGKIRLITNHPRKIVGLQGFGITVTAQIPLVMDSTDSHAS